MIVSVRPIRERLIPRLYLDVVQEPFLLQQRLERRQKVVVVAVCFVGILHLCRAVPDPDLFDQVSPELIPGVVALFRKKPGHAEHPTLPGRIEHHLAIGRWWRDPAVEQQLVECSFANRF